MARAITLTLPIGSLQLVHLDEQPPHPGPRQVLVRMSLRPVGPLELIFITNPSSIPYIVQGDQTVTLGFEGFGIVDKIGEGVTQFNPGQRVVPILWRAGAGQGSWQDYVLLNETDVVAVPDSVSDEAAAQFIANPWTVYGLLEDLAVPKGEYIIQTAASSVLGRQLIQLSKHRGIKTINIIRRDEWKEELKNLGADEVINSATEDVVARVKEITRGKLAYGAVDAVGGVLTKSVAASVKDGGKVLLYGSFSGSDFSQNILDLKRGVQVSWWTLYRYVDTEAKQQYVAAEVMKLLQENVITPLAGKKFPLEDFEEAIRESQKEARGGKVLLRS